MREPRRRVKAALREQSIVNEWCVSSVIASANEGTLMSILATASVVHGGILNLRELIKAILPTTSYATKAWVETELVPTLNSVATQLEALHSSVTTNGTGDHYTRVMLSIFIVCLVIGLALLFGWVRAMHKTVRRVSQGLTVVSAEMKIRPTEKFPNVKY